MCVDGWCLCVDGYWLCVLTDAVFVFQRFKEITGTARTLEIVGLCVSLVSTILSLVIFCYFRSACFYSLSLTIRSYFSQCVSPLSYHPLLLQCVSSLSYLSLLLRVSVCLLSLTTSLTSVSVYLLSVTTRSYFSVYFLSLTTCSYFSQCVSSLSHHPLLLQSVCIFSLLPPAHTSVCIISLLPPALTLVSVYLLTLTTRSYFALVCVSSLLSSVTSGSCDCIFFLYGHLLLLSTGPHVRSHCS